MPKDFCEEEFQREYPRPYYTSPNQRTIQIHRKQLEGSFLGINNDSWMAASRDLGATGLRLYLYLASNRDGYKFALSPEDIRLETGMPRSTYHDWFKILQEKGYLVHAHGNTFDFYEVPRSISLETSGTSSVHDNQISTVDGFVVPNDGSLVLAEDIEINRINKTINNKIIDSENFFQKKENNSEKEKVVFDFHGMF